ASYALRFCRAVAIESQVMQMKMIRELLARQAAARSSEERIRLKKLLEKNSLRASTPNYFAIILQL
ncbi:MAG: hypothetical protein LH679_11400, partial [Cyanobacteria bacterium CAN_BIN43]|nr:hypothetical protein [Cyanobacteria bacterium CAN_BIN43]